MRRKRLTLPTALGKAQIIAASVRGTTEFNNFPQTLQYADIRGWLRQCDCRRWDFVEKFENVHASLCFVESACLCCDI